METRSTLAMVALGVLLAVTSGTSTPSKTQQVAYSSGSQEQLPRRVMLIPDEDEEYPYGSGPSFRSAVPSRSSKPSSAVQRAEKLNKEKGWLDNIFPPSPDSAIFTSSPSSSSNEVHHVIHLADGSTYDVGSSAKPSKIAGPGAHTQDTVPLIIVGVPVSQERPHSHLYAPSYQAYSPIPNYPPHIPVQNHVHSPVPNIYAPNYQTYAPNYPPHTHYPPHNHYPPHTHYPPHNHYPYGYYPPHIHQAPPRPYWPPYRPPYRPPNRGPNGWYGSYYGYRPFGGPGAYQISSDPNAAYDGYGKPGTLNYRPSHHHHRPSWNYDSHHYPNHHHHWHNHEDEDDDDDDDDHHHSGEFSHYPNDYHYPHDLVTNQKQNAARKGLLRPQGEPAKEEQMAEPELDKDHVPE